MTDRTKTAFTAWRMRAAAAIGRLSRAATAPGRLTTVLLVLLTGLALPVSADDAALRPDEVRQWLTLGIDITQLQRRMAAQAANHDDLPRSSAAVRATLLERSGYGAARFDAHAQRIHAAATALGETESRKRALADAEAEVQRYCAPDAAQAMDMPTDSENERARMLADMRAMGLTEAQLGQMREALQQMPSAQQAAEDFCGAAREQLVVVKQAHQHSIEATRQDWPAVRPWLGALDHFHAWSSGKRSDPPALR